MKKILTILLTIISINLFSDENIGYRVNFYDTIEFKSPFILQNGDTCEIFLVNDSICMKCNSGDTVRIDGTTVNLSNYPTRTELGDTASAVETRANDYTDNVNVNYSVSLSSDLNSLSPSINETAFVSETGKNYYWDGIEWNEITASVSITDNQISFSQSTLEEIVDYVQLDSMNIVASSYFIVNSGTSPTLWNSINLNTNNIILAGNKRADLYYNNNQDTIYHLGGDLFSDYQIIYDTALNIVSALTYGTSGRNNVHSVFTGNSKVYKSFITLGSFDVNGSTYTTTDNSDGFIIIENENTYIADTVYPIFTGIGVQQTNQGIYDPYTNLIYFTGRTQNTEFTINSTDGNDTTITQTNYSLTIAVYDSNFVLQTFYHMPTSNIANTNTQIYVTQNYIYWLCAVNGSLTLPDETVLSTPGASSNPFLIKFDKNFNIIYSRTLRSTGIVSGYDIEIDESDNVRMVYSRSTTSLDIQTSDVDYSVTSVNKYGGTDAGEVTWNNNGNYVNYYEFGGSGNDLIQGSLQTKDFTLISGYSNSTTLTIGDSVLNHGNTNTEGFMIYINKNTGNLIKGNFYTVSAVSGTIRKILSGVSNDYVYGVYVIDDPSAGNVTIGDSIYPSPGVGNNLIIPFKFAINDYKKGLALNHDKIFIGDYYNGKYVEYDTTTHAMTYYDPPSSFSGNQIPSMTAVQTEISEIDSSWNSININKLQSKDNDSIIVDSVIYFNSAIKLKVKVFSFSVDKDLDYSDANAGIITITNNCTLEAINLPPGIPVMLWLRWSGGDYTVTLSNMTQMVGNTQTLQELNGAKDIIQLTLDPWDGTIDYVIINKYTP